MKNPTDSGNSEPQLQVKSLLKMQYLMEFERKQKKKMCDFPLINHEASRKFVTLITTFLI